MRPTIVLTGGGSGGHITPLIAVAHELKRRHPKARLVYVGQKGDKFGDLPAADANIDEVFQIRAGKFRRYHGESFWRQLIDIPTLLKNIRDFFYVIIGTWQSRRLLKQLRPDVVFIKGGFVGVPVGLAAAGLRVPYVTHDSDAMPGLANRLVGRWAAAHAVALQADNYAYPADKTVMTGIPLQRDFQPVTKALKNDYRKSIGVPLTAKLLFVIGGGLGAQRVNRAVATALPHLLAEFKDLHVVQAVGEANEAEMQVLYDERLSAAEQDRVEVKGFIDDVYRYAGAADIVITRAGATNLAEFALQGKACVVIPSPFLTGGHQLKNARYLAEQGAALVLDEAELTADPNRLAKQVSRLLSEPTRQQKLGEHLSKFAKPDAAEELAAVILAHMKTFGTNDNETVS